MAYCSYFVQKWYTDLTLLLFQLLYSYFYTKWSVLNVNLHPLILSFCFSSSLISLILSGLPQPFHLRCRCSLCLCVLALGRQDSGRCCSCVTFERGSHSCKDCSELFAEASIADWPHIELQWGGRWCVQMWGRPRRCSDRQLDNVSW